MSFKIINRNLFGRQHRLITKHLFSKRTILSPAYQCTDDWNKRLNDPLIKDIEIETYFYQLNEKLTKKTSIAPTDVDLFLNRAGPENLNEVTNVVQRFRKNWRSHAMLESSHHAFIRILLASGNLDKLVEALSKRFEFGIFPDKFSYNLVLDALLEAKQYENAAKVAVLRMLQEDLDSMIGNYLSLKAIDMYIKTADPIKPELFSEPKVAADGEDGEENKDDDEDEDEVEYIRIPYLRNPYFDDHFDLKETYSLIGKTFYLIGNAIRNQNQELSDNCILYGLIMYKKWDMVTEFLNSKTDLKLSADLVEQVEKFVSSLENPDENANQLVDKLKCIKNVSTKTLGQSIDDAVRTVGSLENDEIRELKEMFKEFSQAREEKMKTDLDELLKLEIIEQIKEKRKEFAEREKRLYFFENYERFELLEHEAKIKIKEAEESMNIEEEYIPPKIRR